MYHPLMAVSAGELEILFGEIMNESPFLRTRKNLIELSGGLTNRNIKVETENGDFVARISSNESTLLSIDRNNEFHNSKLAAEVGIGAPVFDYKPEHGLLVIGFLPGRTFEGVDVANNASRIAESVKTLHQAPKFKLDFDMFQIQSRYLQIVTERGFRLPDGYDTFVKAKEDLQIALARTDTGKVPCNNDLLPANFIDDGQKVWLIDYEYSGNNDPCFELGNIWSESGQDFEVLHELIKGYYGQARQDKFARAWLFSVLAKYGWTLWASIQDSISEIDFDFWQWGMQKYHDVQRDFGSKEFYQQLSNLK
jgi:thiamine kinase-like enzyme